MVVMCRDFRRPCVLSGTTRGATGTRPIELRRKTARSMGRGFTPICIARKATFRMRAIGTPVRARQPMPVLWTRNGGRSPPACLLQPAPTNRSRRLFKTTRTVLPSWTATPMARGIGKRNRARHHDDRSQSYGDVLMDDPARAKAQRPGEQKILEAVVHEDPLRPARGPHPSRGHPWPRRHRPPPGMAHRSRRPQPWPPYRRHLP